MTDRIRFLFLSGEKEPYLAFYRTLGFRPHNLTYYKVATLHRSNSIRHNGEKINNERLEFLGDAVLNAVVGDIVFNHFRKNKEGFLTNMRSKIVQRETLNKLAIQIGLDKLVGTIHITSHNSNVYGNAFEALVGAIYLDQGYGRCMDFMRRIIAKKYIDLDEMSRTEANFKSKLIEWSQKNKVETSFELINQVQDSSCNPMFRSEVRISGFCAGTGEGYSKKESQQNAAKMAMNRLHTDAAFREAILSKGGSAVASAPSASSASSVASVASVASEQ